MADVQTCDTTAFGVFCIDGKAHAPDSVHVVLRRKSLARWCRDWYFQPCRTAGNTPAALIEGLHAFCMRFAKVAGIQHLGGRPQTVRIQACDFVAFSPGCGLEHHENYQCN